MSEMTTMSSEELAAFSSALEAFITNVEMHCTKMENGIAECSTFMKDESSQKALNDAEQICIDILSTLSPAQMLLDKVLRMSSEFSNSPTM